MTQFRSQQPSAWAGTWLWMKRVHWLGSSPAARSIAATERVLRRRASGSWGVVMACRSTMQKKLTFSLCRSAQPLMAPR